MTRVEFEQCLTEFVNRRLVKSGDAPDVDAETLLFESGVINSLRILDLIAFVENTLGTKIPDRVIRLQNFRSIRTIAHCFLGEGPHGAA